MQLLKYLKSTRGLKLKLSVDDLYIVKWWVDASYAVHKEYNGNTRVMVCLGKGDVGSFTRKKRIQGNISTEDEIIGTYDAIPQDLWSKYFIEDQGYTMEQNIIHQDKKMATLLKVNGKFSR